VRQILRPGLDRRMQLDVALGTTRPR
jgi:hypothetical protein